MLARRGVHPSRKRVARLMRSEGLTGLVKRRRGRTTVRVPGLATSPDLVRREWNPTERNRLWVADITYCRTWEGWLYLAAVLDCHSRRVVGWSIRQGLEAELVTEAIEMAVTRRRPAEGLVHHSDRGSQYVSLAFGERCRQAGIDLSMTRRRVAAGQRRRGVVLREAEEGARQPLLVVDEGRPEGCGLRVDRGLLQPPAHPHDARRLRPGGV